MRAIMVLAAILAAVGAAAFIRALVAASELAEMNLQKLRRAVVMAEVLDRPVALRRGRR